MIKKEKTVFENTYKLATKITVWSFGDERITLYKKINKMRVITMHIGIYYYIGIIQVYYILLYRYNTGVL
jgi:hypothetical protein